MWATPDGERVLFVAGDEARRFVSAVYRFDRCVIGPLRVDRQPRALWVTIADRAVAVTTGQPRPILGPRPRFVTRYVEAPLARRLMGVEPYGVSPTGVREWYQARSWAPLVSAVATIEGTALGAMTSVDPPCRFGFSEPPRRPSLTEVRPKLHDPSGRLDLFAHSHRRDRGYRSRAMVARRPR